jgi:hypothetical protein
MTAPRLFVSVVAASLFLVVSSCGDRSPTGVPSEIETPAQEGLFGWLAEQTRLLRCSPLPAASTSETIGPEGGTIRVGPHSLSIPAGALDAAVTITATIPVDTVNRIRFAPSGLTFDVPARLTMSYANCDIISVLLPKRIAFMSGETTILEYLLSIDLPLSRVVKGRLEHFSNYAIAW